MSDFSDPALRKKAEYLGTLGWVVPFQLAPRNVRLLLDDILIDSQQDVDSMFIQFYEDWMLLPRAFVSLRTESFFQKHNTLIEQAITAYENESYTLVVSSLVSVVEGLLSELTSDIGQSMKPKLQMIEMAAMADMNILTAPVFLSLNSFLKILYSTSDFSKTQPAMFNRHWISHGRAEVANVKADALRVINAINCIGYAVKYVGP